MHASDKVVLADFRSRGGDSTLGLALTEALRTDLSQSRAIALVPPSQIRGALSRMGRPTAGELTASLAREVALREGAKAVIDGDVTPVGTGYLLTVRLIVRESGDALASISETPDRPSEVVAAVGRLSRALRSKIGESLKSVQSAPPLERVTTTSLEALQKYTEGSRAYRIENDLEKAVTDFSAAVAIDSNFAMAYRRLSLVYGAMGGHEVDAADAIKRAYDLRSRVPALEAHLIAAAYWQSGAADDDGKAMSEIDAALAIDPENPIALNGAGLLLATARNHRGASERFARSAIVDSLFPEFAMGNLATEQLALGDTAGALRTMADLDKRRPGSSSVIGTRAGLFLAIHQFDSALDQVRMLSPRRPRTRGRW